MFSNRAELEDMPRQSFASYVGDSGENWEEFVPTRISKPDNDNKPIFRYLHNSKQFVLNKTLIEALGKPTAIDIVYNRADKRLKIQAGTSIRINTNKSYRAVFQNASLAKFLDLENRTYQWEGSSGYKNVFFDNVPQ